MGGSLCIYNQRFLCPSQNHRFSNLKSSSGCSIHPASSLEHKLWCINRTSQNQHLKEIATTSDLHKGLRVYEGGCHCGAIRIRIEAPSKLQVHECNCSICRKKGNLHLYVPPENFTQLSGKDSMSTYTFNTGIAKHHFCSTCGICVFYGQTATRKDAHSEYTHRDTHATH